jgi:hypothetical protein
MYSGPYVVWAEEKYIKNSGKRLFLPYTFLFINYPSFGAM